MERYERDTRWAAEYELYDLDGNGVLEPKDIAIATENRMRVRGVAPESADGRAIRHLFHGIVEGLAKYDANGDGKVSRAEYVDYVTTALVRDGMPTAELLGSLRVGWQLFDANGDGRFCARDYARWAEVIHVPGSSDASAREAHFAALAAHYGDGAALDYDQFLAASIEMLCAPRPTPYWFPL